MGDYSRGMREEMDEILDFANMVFSMSSGSVDFESLLPKAYSQERNMLASHHCIKENGKIKAFIDALPMNLRIGEESIKAAYIGTVSVHPKARGKNYMITLMEEAEKHERSVNTDVMILDGNRHRYQHYGFEKAGIKYCFNITGDSIRHCCNAKGRDAKEYSFELIGEKDEPFIDKAYALYEKRNIVTRTREDFYLYLKSWHADTYAVWDGEELIGYMNISADERNIFEVELDDMEAFPFVIQAFMTEFCSDELGINVGMDEIQKIELLDEMSDYYTVNPSHQIKILNYENTLRFFLKWKSVFYKVSGSMQEGSFVLGVYTQKEEVVRKYLMEYKQGTISVAETDLQADMVLEEKELIKTLTTSYYFHALQKPDSPLKTAPQGWFPLPFFLPEADAF